LTAYDQSALSPVARLVPELGDAVLVLLRNIGGKPLRLRASLLAEGGSRADNVACWHEIAIYRIESGQIAIALRFLRFGSSDIGVHRAKVFEDLDAAATWLEHFDPSVDVAAGFDVAEHGVSGAGVVVQAAALRERIERLDRAYRGLVGELLFRLEAEL
jgi:hypothetical protein